MENNVTMNLIKNMWTMEDMIKKVGWQFYLVDPREHMFEKIDDLPTPPYTSQVNINLKECQ